MNLVVDYIFIYVTMFSGCSSCLSTVYIVPKVGLRYSGALDTSHTIASPLFVVAGDAHTRVVSEWTTTAFLWACWELRHFLFSCRLRGLSCRREGLFPTTSRELWWGSADLWSCDGEVLVEIWPHSWLNITSNILLLSYIVIGSAPPEKLTSEKCFVVLKKLIPHCFLLHPLSLLTRPQAIDLCCTLSLTTGNRKV